MNKITVSVPGKLMIMGEHAVVYGRPCLVASVDPRMKVNVELLTEPVFKLEAPDVKITQYQKPLSEVGKGIIPKGAKFVEMAIMNFINKNNLITGMRVTTAPGFSAGFGFGSSSAVLVGVIKALSELLKLNYSQKELFDLAYKTTLDVQGKGSGFDAAAAIYGGTLYFKKGGEIIEPLLVADLNLVVGYCGVKADTISMVDLVEGKRKEYKKGVEKIFDNIGNLVIEAKKAILGKDWERLGILMNYNQNYLEDLGVSTDKLNRMIEVAQKAGAFGAKLSGAGGGDCMIALVPSAGKNIVQEAIKSVGGDIIDTVVSVEGARKENI